MVRVVSVRLGARVRHSPLISMVAERAVRRAWTIFLMLVPVVSCRWRATARVKRQWCWRVRWPAASSSLLPVVGQGRVVRGRVGLDHLVTTDRHP